MSAADLVALLPLLLPAAGALLVLAAAASAARYTVTFVLTVVSILASLASLAVAAPLAPHGFTAQIMVDGLALFGIGLILATTLVVALVSYAHMREPEADHGEYYFLLLLASLGSCVLAAAAAFAAFFLGLELLSVSLFGMIAYRRDRAPGTEAAIKYLVLAGASAAFLLFGMALVYAETGSMEFARVVESARSGAGGLLTTGIALMIVGIGFKLAVVPFHLWTPDVYDGAPAPVSGYIATVSKGAVFAVVLRYFSAVDIHAHKALFLVFTMIAIASMFTGNFLALLQRNVKRILAYSSISHLGYLLVAFLASGPMAAASAAFYLTAYFVTTLGVFGIVTVLSPADRDADRMEDYQGLAWHRPWPAGVFTAMLLSLAGIPLTGGFVGKFYVAAAGVGSALWVLVLVLVINSAIGLFYYLRIIMALYSAPEKAVPSQHAVSLVGGGVLSVLTFLLIWLGIYPGPVIDLITMMVKSLI